MKTEAAGLPRARCGSSARRWVTIAVAALLLLSACRYGPFTSQTVVLPTGNPVRPNDPRFESDQWYLSLLGLESAWGTYRAVAADPIAGPDLGPVRVAIIDSGVVAGHPDLEAVVSAESVDLVRQARTATPGGVDPSVQGLQHGTHVAGLAGAVADNAVGISGAAFNSGARTVAEIVSVRALEWSPPAEPGGIPGIVGNLSDLIESIEYSIQADSVADLRIGAPASVVNMSLGASQLSEAEIMLVESVLEVAAARDVLMLAAAGNGFRDGVDWPAASAYVIAVGSVDFAESPAGATRSTFSDTGPELELTAPGALRSGPEPEDAEGVLSTYPNRSYDYLPGTSMATPLVTGIASLIRSANPFLTAEEVRTVLRETAYDLGEPGRDPEYGFGLVQADAALERALEIPFGRFSARSDGGSDPNAPSVARLREANHAAGYRAGDFDDGGPTELLLYVTDSFTPAEVPEWFDLSSSGSIRLAHGRLHYVTVGAGRSVVRVVDFLRSNPEVLLVVPDRELFTVR